MTEEDENSTPHLISLANKTEWSTEKKRNYIGASLIGHQCLRYIQYEFQNEEKSPPPKPENIRKMQMGHEFEHKMKTWMMQAGFEFEDSPDPVNPFPEHMDGHVDGIITKCPLAIQLPAVWENKSMGKTGYNALVKHRLKTSNQKYYVQLQIYMYFFGCDTGVFTAINRETCEIYEEIVLLDEPVIKMFLNNFDFIVHNIREKTLSPRLASEPDNYLCRMCSHIKTCWKDN